MPTTSNFGWTTPADTDLVKDGAAAIRTLGNGIDASLVDLKGGTTGQILSKNSNTDLDYTWINNDQGDITAVTAGTGLTGGGTTGAVTLTNDMATTITASGDIVVGTGNGTYDNLPIGTTGQVLTADTTVSPYKVKWAAPSSMTLITSGTFGSNGFSLTSITGTYTDLYLWVYGAKTTSANHYYGVWFNNSSGTGKYSFRINSSDDATNYIRFSTTAMGNAATTNTLGVLVKNYSSSAYSKPVYVVGHNYNGTTYYPMFGGGSTNDSAAVTRIDLQEASAGSTFTAGNYELWGIK